jgi:outer membrane protein assembly factor BamE (lipoprotein component of BamABCDE complex)
MECFHEEKGDFQLNRFREILFVLLLVFFLSSCAGWVKNMDYHPFDAAKLDKLIPGKSTAAQVTEILGAPSEIVKLSNGNAYIYRRSLSKGTGLWLLIVSFGNYDEHHDQIVIFFNKGNIMTHYGVTLDAHKATYGLP